MAMSVGGVGVVRRYGSVDVDEVDVHVHVSLGVLVLRFEIVPGFIRNSNPKSSLPGIGVFPYNC